MEVVFIRHGQTNANRDHRHQSIDEPLNDNGRSQAQQIAIALSAWQPTHILSSPMKRAHQTADIISASTNVSVELLQELRELRRPLWIFNKRHRSAWTAWYILRWFFSSHQQFDNARQGESYLTFRKRLERVRSLLEQYPTDARIVVVSHSVFINFFTEHVCNTEKLSLWRAFPRFAKVLLLRNTNATRVIYAPADSNVCAWQLLDSDISVEKLT